MIRALGTYLWPAFLDILFPGICLGCGNDVSGRRSVSFCRKCLAGIRFVLEPFCTVCGRPFDSAGGANHLCGLCLNRSWCFRQARAMVYYQPPVTEAVKTFKYNGRMDGLATFGALAEHYFRHQPYPTPDVIIPVPLHVKRLRQRGFNQALVLARKILKASRDRIEPRVLERHHWVRTQAGLSGRDRRQNVKNAFRVRRAEKVQDRMVLLVDDVFTTGATVNECARILTKNGAAAVDVLTFARVVR